MTDHDRAAARREITDALQKALDRRHEVLDVIVEADDKPTAVAAIAALLDTSKLGGEAVMAMAFNQLTKDARRKIADELDDLNKQLTFTLGERPASSGESLLLRMFSAGVDRELFAARTEDVGATGDGSGRPAGDLDDELNAAVARVSAEEAVWLVAEELDDKVGMVFGELVGGEVNVRIWIHPDYRHRGYGTAALRRCRSEMAAYFPGVPMVVRAPGAEPGAHRRHRRRDRARMTDAALAAAVAQEAGELLLRVREEVGYYDPYELGDAGDAIANKLILARLFEQRPQDAVLSEEAADDLARVDADRVWIVDPVDGTWEFSKRGHVDWAVHIALWQRTGGPDGIITDAAVALPAVGELYRTDTVTGPPPRTEGPIRIATSANRPPPILWWLRKQLDVQLIGIGSAGAKAMAVVRGDVDAYVHAGGQWEWDSAAPAGVVLAAGLHASRIDGSPLIYNQRDPYLPDFLMCRPELSQVLLDAIRSAY